MNRKNRVLILALAMLLLCSILATALASNALRASGKAVTISEEEYARLLQYEKLEMLRQIVQSQYYEDVSDEALLTGAAEGLLYAVGDPYTFYYTEETMARMKESETGEYTGIGVQILANPNDFLITVTRVFEGSPAEAAGIRPGDKIVRVEELDVTAYEINEAVAIMRGEPGTQTHITIMRGGELIEMDVARAKVIANAVTFEVLEGDVGYVQLYSFEADVVEGFRRAVQAFRDAKVAGMIIDLRDNPGGLVDDAVAICDDLLPEGLIVYTEDKYGRRMEDYSNASSIDWPIVVLVNGNSASASEILVAALKDYGRTTLVGENTFGKGIVQSSYSFADGTGMQVTIARFYTPNGICIHGTGIAPDIEVVLPEDVWDENNQIPREKDAQLQAAIEALRARIAQFGPAVHE